MKINASAPSLKRADPQPRPKPTTLRRTSRQAPALRHGEKPEKTSCTAEARRRGEEFNFDEKFAQKRGNSGLVIRSHGENKEVYSWRNAFRINWSLTLSPFVIRDISASCKGHALSRTRKIL